MILSGIGRIAALLVFPVALSQAGVPQEPGPPDSGARQRQAPDDARPLPLLGKITAIHEGSLEVTNPNGETTTVKVTPKTEFRKDRQSAKRGDFKVGDLILVRGDENPDHSWTAQVIGARSMNGRGGPGGGFVQGTLGKDYVAGEIKFIDAPKLSVLRSDNVTQSLELNEETSLRRGRESITMADIQVGDHVFVRGAVESKVFVPKTVVVIAPEQWKRMQEWAGQNGEQRRAPAPPADADSQTPKSSEPPH